MPPTERTPELIALDWGTTRLRGFLMAGGEVLATRTLPHGIQHLPMPGREGFEQAFAGLAGDWLQRWPGLPAVACGMVGSAQGWREAPYLRCPASLQALASQGVAVPTGLGRDLLIAPGLLFDPPDEAPDVMRGEEIQIAGALHRHPRWAEHSIMVLPGTHSKWVRVEAGRITRFGTYLTGEVFAVLRAHSILGRLMPAATEDEVDSAAFEQGLDAAARSGPGDLLHQCFAVRTLGLTGRLPAASLGDHLSGLLIGHELVSALAWAKAGPPAPLVLIGDPGLCRRYASALKRIGGHGVTLLDNTAPAGLWDLACHAGLAAQAHEGTAP